MGARELMNTPDIDQTLAAPRVGKLTPTHQKTKRTKKYIKFKV